MRKQKMQEIFEKELDKEFPASKPHEIIIFENNQSNIKKSIKEIHADFDKLRGKIINLTNRVK